MSDATANAPVATPAPAAASTDAAAAAATSTSSAVSAHGDDTNQQFDMMLNSHVLVVKSQMLIMTRHFTTIIFQAEFRHADSPLFSSVWRGRQSSRG